MKVTVAAVLEVGPDDVFLREAEHTKPTATHGGVYGDPRVSHQLRAFVKPHPAGSTDARGKDGVPLLASVQTCHFPLTLAGPCLLRLEVPRHRSQVSMSP